MFLRDVRRAHGGESHQNRELPRSERNTPLGIARWSAEAGRWEMEAREVPPDLRELVPDGWVESTLAQSVIRKELLEEVSAPIEKSIEHWREIEGEWLDFDVVGNRVTCSPASDSASVCWDGKVTIYRRTGMESREAVGHGTMSVRGARLRDTRDVAAATYSRVERKIEAEISLQTGRLEWTQDCRTTFQPLWVHE